MKVVFTATDLAKGLVDVPTELQAALARSGIHDFAAQTPGERPYPTIKCFVRGDRDSPCELGACRPKTKSGQFRRFSRIAHLVRRLGLNAGDSVFFEVIATSANESCLVASIVSRSDISPSRATATVDTVHPSEPHTTPASQTWHSDRGVGVLLERAFGGSDVAAQPGLEDGTADFWPTGRASLGANEACRMLVSACSTDGNVESRWVFLVGGAGNGKSYLARETIRELRLPVRSPDALAQRRYDFVLGNGGHLMVINDATIIGSDAHTDLHALPPLCRDMKDASGARASLLASVNRGILIEELERLEVLEPMGDISRELLADCRRMLRWLLGTHSTDSDTPNANATILAETFSLNGFTFTASVAFMDRYSLFATTAVPGHDDSPSRYVVTSPTDPELDESVASELLKDITSRLSGLGGLSDECPIKANIETLSTTDGRRGLLTALRCAEIASSHRLTYRDFWGLIAMSFIGPRRTAFSDALQRSPTEWTASQLSSAKQRSGESRLGLLLDLARHRYSMALFDSDPRLVVRTMPAAPATPERDMAAVKILQHVDPARDALEWATPVFDAMEAVSLEELPSELLKEDGEPGFSAAWQPFDALLEATLLAHVWDPATDDLCARSLLNWYGSYLLRLYGLATGNSGRLAESIIWCNNWRAATTGHLEHDLEDAIIRLLLPEVSGHGPGKVLLPALTSRTWAVRSASDDAMLVVCKKSGDITVRAAVRGDDMLLRIGVSGSDTEVPLDLPLLREAWCCRSGLGFTEHSDAISPRLERARASLLRVRTDGTGQRYGIFDGAGFSEIVLVQPVGRAR